MKWLYPRRRKTTPILNKLNKHQKRKSKDRGFYKYRIALMVFLLLLGWIWSAAYDKGSSLMGQLMMLFAGIYIAKDLYHLFYPDPVDEAINDLEQQFWDLEFRKDSDSTGVDD